MASSTRLTLLAFALTSFAVAADRTPAPLPPDAAVASQRLPEGFRSTLVAAEPRVVQPISFCVDDRGRLVVAEALNYGEWQPTGKDRIVILTDNDGDGSVDDRRVFYEGLNYVTGIEVGFGGVWAMSPPSLYFIPDRNGDDRPDGPPQVIFDGFGYRESRHNLANGFTWGPDGWLYAGHGRTSPSEIGPPGSPPDKRVHCDGGVIRIHPTRRVVENVADGTTNPWGVSFNDWGECFVSNCVNPHLFHVVPGAHYEPWRQRPSSLYAYDRIATIADHLHYPSNRPNAMRGETEETLAMGGGHAHCGTLVYLGNTFPAAYRNSVLMCNVHGRRINCDRPRPSGSGYVASHSPDLMISGDPWFMGVTLQASPDGGVFVSDWSDTGECHTYKPERGTGRIFHLQYGDPPRPRVDLAAESDLSLVARLWEPNDWYVVRARRLLQERHAAGSLDRAAVLEPLKTELNGSATAPRRLRALWALWVIDGVDPQQLRGLLEDRDEHLRAWGVRLCCEQGAPPAEVLPRMKQLATADSSAVVRLSLASCLRRLPLDQRWAIAAGLASHAEDARDQNLPLMVWYGIEPCIPTDGNQALAWAVSARIPKLREFAARRFLDHAQQQGESFDLAPLVDALREAPAEVARDLLVGAHESLRGRRHWRLPANWNAVASRLQQLEDPLIRELVTIMSVIFGDPVALADLRNQVSDRSRPLADRQLALDALVEKGDPSFAPTLLKLLDDDSLRHLAIQGLAAVPHEDAPRRLIDSYSRWSPEDQQAVVATLASRKPFAVRLLEAIEQGRIPRRDVTTFIARQIHAFGDKPLNERLKKAWGEIRESTPQRRERIAQLRRELTPDVLRYADLANGRRLFSKSCQNCHKLFGEGASIGPDLTGSQRTNVEYLLSNIVDPSAEIAREFRMQLVVTTEGRVLTGLLVENTPARVTIQTTTERVAVPRESIEEIAESKLSMMPEGQLDTLNPAEIRDLIGYLGSQ